MYLVFCPMILNHWSYLQEDLGSAIQQRLGGDKTRKGWKRADGFFLTVDNIFPKNNHCTPVETWRPRISCQKLRMKTRPLSFALTVRARKTLRLKFVADCWGGLVGTSA